ncbi:DUF5678 domain-containing protein [Dehalococcoidia bacterium]|nr:DUF5678 domain-containing protein [Dehalococcoidia bacterium]MCL0093233.1 DUF5678 domain-containing protein [Dehalococcoidia bacterium]MCL0095960.1 DUF5678 domain-containing protein [Dehalococcoidia bacterium]
MSHEYLMKHSQQLFEKFSGKYIAIIGEEVITASESGIEAFRRAKEKHRGEEVHISYIPTEEELVTLL